MASSGNEPVTSPATSAVLSVAAGIIGGPVPGAVVGLVTGLPASVMLTMAGLGALAVTAWLDPAAGIWLGIAAACGAFGFLLGALIRPPAAYRLLIRRYDRTPAGHPPVLVAAADAERLAEVIADRTAMLAGQRPTLPASPADSGEVA